MLAGAFAADLGIRRLVLPYTASVNCAFGLISADVVHEYSVPQLVAAPARPSTVDEIFAPLLKTARAQLSAEGFEPSRIVLERSVDLRYGRQVHELTTPLRGTELLDDAALIRLVGDFERFYERRFGKGSAYREAGIEMTRFRLTARGLLDRAPLVAAAGGAKDASRAKRGTRKAFSEVDGAMIDMAIYDFELLSPGNVVNGPAIIHTPITTLVLQSRQSGRMDPYRNIIVDLGLGEQS
jgi:N-methylhydantoinase A